jgi:hypothetical protein
MKRHLILSVLWILGELGVFAQVTNSAWIYPSSSGNLIYQLDERGQRIADFSNCGYLGGTSALPNVLTAVAQNRWVYVSPGAGDDTALVQAAIDAVSALTPDANGWRGVVYLNAGEFQISSQGAGSLKEVQLIAGGAGYSTAPTVTLSGGGGATATATVSGGVVTAVTVTNTGSSNFYNTIPTVTLSGGGGSGAMAQAIISGQPGLKISTGGVVLKGAGSSPTTGTRLRATTTPPFQYKVIDVNGAGNGAFTSSGSRLAVSNTTHNLTQPLVPAGTRTFQVDSTSGLAVGHTVIVKRPCTTDWITSIGMGPTNTPSLEFPWVSGEVDLYFDRVVTRIEGTWITVDAPLPQTFETVVNGTLNYGGGQIWRYNWERDGQVGIEDIYAVSDYNASISSVVSGTTYPSDEAHAWAFINMAEIQNGWVRNVTAQNFGYTTINIDSGSKWITVADSQCLDPVSIITGERRYSFKINEGDLILFQNNIARKGRHDFVFGSAVAGPNAFVQCKGTDAYADVGPHFHWTAGGLFDGISQSGAAAGGSGEINIRNRGNAGTSHGWAGAYCAVWNSTASAFRVRNPPTARNWLVGSVGSILSSNIAVGADPEGTYDSSGTTGKAVYPKSIYYGQVQQKLKWANSEFREAWMGDVDQFASTSGAGEALNCDAAWLTQMQALGTVSSKFDYLMGGRNVAFTIGFTLDPGDTVVAASLTVSLRDIGAAAGDDSIRLDSVANVLTYASLGWTPIATNGSTVRTLEVDSALLNDGKLNVGLGADSAVDFAVLHYQVQKAQPNTYSVTLNPVADAYVRGGTNAASNFGTEVTLQTKDVTTGTNNRECYLRWDLSAVSGKLVSARARFNGISASQLGNETSACFVSDDSWGETTINFNNKPDSGKLFAQWLPVTGQAVEFSVTPQVNDTLLTDKKLSLRVLSTGDYGGSGNVTMASRESATATNRPQLILTLENTAPTIGNVVDQAVNEDAATGPLAFIVADAETSAASLTVTGTSSNTTLVPVSNILISGSGASRSVSITPALNQSGTAMITLTVSDGMLTASDTFLLTVAAMNDLPVAVTGAASTQANQAVDIDLWSLVSDAETAVTGLRFSVSGGVNGSVVLLADGHTARFTPSNGFTGAASFAYSAQDTGTDPRTLLHYDFQLSNASDTSNQGRVGTFTTGGVAGTVSYTADLPSALIPQQLQSLRLAQNGATGGVRLDRMISETTDLNLKTADWTAAGWFKRTAITDQDVVFHLGANGGNGSSNELSLSFANGSNTLTLKNWNSSSNDVTLTATVSAAAWHHFAITRSGASLVLYIDGVSVGSDNAFTMTFDQTNPLIFGACLSSSASTWDRWFNGSLADLAIFRAALPAADIVKLSTAPVVELASHTSSNIVNIMVNKIPATVTLGALSQVYDGSAKVATATTSPAITGSVGLTYGGLQAAPSQVGSYSVVGTISDSIYTGSSSGTLTIADSVANWRQFHFQSPANSGTAADAADPDGDGMINTQEYVYGCNPNTPDVPPVLSVTKSGGVISLGFVARQTSGAGYAGFTRYFTVESSPNLSNLAAWTALISHSNIVAAGQAVTLSLPSATDRCFYRLKVVVQ